MENKVIDALAEEITLKLKSKIFNIEKWMEEFLKAQISEEIKEKVLEQLYLFQLYSNAYIGPDVRRQRNLINIVSSVLNSKNDEDVLNKIENLKETIEFLKNIETHPLETTKKRIEDGYKYRGTKF